MFPIALRRHIILLLAAKAVLLVALYMLFFSPAHRPAPSLIQSHILGAR
ncbi:MAG TPA: hypothetical protein VGC16_02025 [Rhizomicrobium sp.]